MRLLAFLLPLVLLAGCVETLRAPDPETAPTAATPGGTPGGGATGGEGGGAGAGEPVEVAVALVDATPSPAAPSAIYGISPAKLELRAGVPVSLTVTNEGRGSHDLVIEGLDVQTEMLQAGASQTIVFTPVEAGTYRMYCSIGKGSPVGHDERGMNGEVVVS